MTDIYLNQLEIRTPRADGVDVDTDTDALELAVEAAVESFGAQAVFDGSGGSAAGIDLFLYAADLDALVDALLAIDYPAGTVGEATMHASRGSSTTTWRVLLAGPRKGRRTKPKVAKSKLRVGDWFLAPVGDNQIVGRVTHATWGYIIAHFFGTLRTTRPTVSELAAYGPDDSIAYVSAFRKRIDDGLWQLLGAAGGFDPADWPLPEFERPWLRNTRLAVVFDAKTLDQDHVRELPESDWYQRPLEDLQPPFDLDTLIDRAINDPDNKYRFPSQT